MSVACRTQFKGKLEPSNNALGISNEFKLNEGVSRNSLTAHGSQLIIKIEKTMCQLVSTTYYERAVQCTCTSVNNYKVR